MFPSGTTFDFAVMVGTDAEAFETLMLWVYGLSMNCSVPQQAMIICRRLFVTRRSLDLPKLYDLRQRFCEDALMDDVMNALRPILRFRAIADNNAIGNA